MSSQRDVPQDDASSSSSTIFDGTAIDHDEHVSNVFGMRRALTAGLVIWTLFGITDWFIAVLIEGGRLWFLLLLRLIGMLCLSLLLARCCIRSKPTPGVLRLIDVLNFASISVLISIACVEFRGFESPLAMGVVTLLASRIGVLPDRWQRALLPVGLIALAHPTTLLIASTFLPELAAQLSNRRALGMAVFNELFILGAAGITLVGGHLVWALRRKVYEARSLGRYRLIRRIGRGGMGEVWIAHHNTLRREVAVKIVRPDRMDETARERFEREVHATSELSHPNTVRVFDYGITEDGICYYAMELLEGEDLGMIIKRDGPLPQRRAAYLVLQAAKAVAEAHSRGIVHRDLKPSNIFITQAGTDHDLVKVVDFGLARMSRSDVDTTLTDTGCIVGTPAYMAPEVLTGEPANAGSDVYSLGAVLYRTLCGNVPFACEDRRAMVQARLSRDPVPCSEVLGKPISGELESIVLRCLNRYPDARYHTAAQLVEDLAEWLDIFPRDSQEIEDSESPTEARQRVVSGGRVQGGVDEDSLTRSLNKRNKPREQPDTAGADGSTTSIHDEKTVIEQKVDGDDLS